MEAINDALEPKESWWKRNWKWAIPTGGCGCLLIVIVGAVIFGIFSIKEYVEDSGTYDQALSRVQDSEAVIEALGEPIETNGLGEYNIQWQNDREYNEMRIPIKGPKGKADLYIFAENTEDTIIFGRLEVVLENSGKGIDLLAVENKE